MKTKHLFVATAVFAGLLNAAPPPDSDHVSGRLLAQPVLGSTPAGVTNAFAKAGARVAKVLDRINIHILQVPEPALDHVADALMKTGMFTFVERDFQARAAATPLYPNDPSFSSQWHLTTIQAPYAWSMTTGVSSVPIAVIDSGAEGTHPDLAPKLISGWNFVTGTSNTADDYGHGTAVAGTAGAATNNLTGVAGVGWNNTVMPLVVLDSTGYASYSNIANAITYAADHGVRVMNISIGGASASSTLQSAVDYAWNKGAVIFASAMNNSTSAPYYPAACNNVIAVSSTSPSDTFSSFSDYGSWIDLSAPGESILTTMTGGSYGYWSGTSFSSPIAAATAGLVLSVKPGLSNSALVTLLEQNSDDLGTTGWDQYFGYGRVNAYKAVLAAQSSSTTDTTPPSVSISSPANGTTVTGSISVQGTATDNVGVTSIQFAVDGKVLASASSSPFSFALNTANYANGSHTIVVNASDAAGNVGSATISVNVANTLAVADITPPSVSISSPANGATVSGNVQIAASASDNVAVSQVSFYVDNVLKCTDTSAPYTCAWNSRKAASGAHTIKATAWDTSSNSSSASITVYK